MKPISRRSVLTMGGLGLISTAVGGTGLWRELNPSVLDASTGESFIEPKVLRNQGGRLEVRLEAALGTHDIAGRQARSMGYNGGVPGPTLRLRPGDTLSLDLVNRLSDVTNLHVHGLHVSPEGNGDNIFLAVEPGQTHRYEHRLPDDHPPGVYWYHPHHHGKVADQVFGGLYGAIIVEDPADKIDVDRERVMVISDITLDAGGSLVTPSTMEQMMGREGELVLLNGQTTPRLEGRAGERERWRIVNACTSRYLALDLPGQESRVVGRDVGRLAQDVALGDVVLAPGNRLDLVVDLTEGRNELVVRPVDRGGMMGGMMGGGGPSFGEDGPVTLARVEVSSGDARARGGIPRAPSLRDLREVEVGERRSITFQMGMGGMMGGGGGPMSFSFDGLEFDADRIDQRVRLGTVEEWTIGNDSPLDHPFHLHVWPMQLLEVDGQEVSEPLWLDVVNVPARSQVKVRVAFADFGGKTVYHCHILDHEDRGMMGTVLAR
ncbi:MAG TPA: multicopper oxidase family protein [Nocardioidaceae bacterium]|nr:multicopper oxidase family protein [Nocardioidaceae bacterium]